MLNNIIGVGGYGGPAGEGNSADRNDTGWPGVWATDTLST
jgi:hypothetical protein